MFKCKNVETKEKKKIKLNKRRKRPKILSEIDTAFVVF